MKMILLLLAGSVSLMILGPFTVHEHYVFGIMALWMILLPYLPKKIAWVLVGALSLFWLTRINFATATIPTPERLACVKKVCANYPQPIYVVTNSGSHDHQGLGYAYLAQQMGCDMFAVTQWKEQQPATMAVMNETVQFDVKGTDFYELNRFGTRQFIAEEECGPNLTATVFSN